MGVFTSIATAEGEIHGLPPEDVHLHEVGAVDAILDVVGVVWGLDRLGIDRVYCGTIALGDGSVRAAHGVLPVPAPATLKLLEGHVEKETDVSGQGFREMRESLVFLQIGPGGQGPLAQRTPRIADQQGRVCPLLRAESTRRSARTE